MPGRGGFIARNKNATLFLYDDPDFPDRRVWMPRDNIPTIADVIEGNLPVYGDTKCLYLIGSLRNPKIPEIGNELRNHLGYEIFDDWFAAGPIADDSWQSYEKGKGISYDEALHGYAANHVFEFDMLHLNRSSGGVLCLPAGKSAHLEAGFLIGQGKPVWMLMEEEPERWDVMVKFARGIYFDIDSLIKAIRKYDGENA